MCIYLTSFPQLEDKYILSIIMKGPQEIVQLDFSGIYMSLVFQSIFDLKRDLENFRWTEYN